MLRGGICDAHCQAFYNKMIKNEEASRIRWFLKNQQKLLDYLEKTKPAKKIELPPTPEQKQPSVDIIYLKPSPNWRPMEPDGIINMDIMKPIDPQVRAILYENEPSFFTADNYIRERLKDNLEDRYYYPDSTNWVYGWRLKDYSPLTKSKFGKLSLVINEFYHPRQSSLQRDPEWYRPPRSTPTACDTY